MTRGPVDGAYGGKTIRAVKRFQEALGEKITGYITKAQSKILFAMADERVKSDDPGSSSDTRPQDWTQFRPKWKVNYGIGRNTVPDPDRRGVTVAKVFGDFCDFKDIDAEGGRPGSAADNTLTAVEFCSTSGIMASLGRNQPEESICVGYARQSELIRRNSQSMSFAEYRSNLGGFAAPEVVDAHRENGQICILQAFTSGDPEAAYFFSALLYGTGNRAFAELLGQLHAIGVGVPADLERGKQWLETAQRAVADGAAPVVAREGEDRVEVIAGMIEEIEKLQETGGSFKDFRHIKKDTGRNAETVRSSRFPAATTILMTVARVRRVTGGPRAIRSKLPR